MSNNNKSFEAMLNTTAQKLGVTPESLKQAAQNGNIADLLSKQSGGMTEEMRKALSNPKEAQKLLSRPEIQKMIRDMGK